MPKAYKLTLAPIDVSEHVEYVVIRDDEEIPGVSDTDAFDPILCSDWNEGYDATRVEEVDADAVLNGDPSFWDFR